MKRASYRHAVWWIAVNDSPGDDDALDPLAVSKLVTALLVADLFDVESEEVGEDIVRVRMKEFTQSQPPPRSETHATR